MTYLAASGPPKSPEQDHTHVEHDPATTPKFNSEVVLWLAPVPVQRVNLREMGRLSLQEWRVVETHSSPEA